MNDIKWADSAKKALIRRKIELLREAVEKRTVFHLDMHLLKTLGRDAFLVDNKEGMDEDLKFIEDLIKKGEGRLRTMKTLPYKKLTTLKKRMFGCVDISKELKDMKMKFKDSQKRRGEDASHPSDGTMLKKRVLNLQNVADKELNARR